MMDRGEGGGRSQRATDNTRPTPGGDSEMMVAGAEITAGRKVSTMSQKFSSSSRLESTAAAMAHADGNETAGDGTDTLRRWESAEGRFTILNERIKDSTDQSFDDSCDESEEADTLCVNPFAAISCNGRRDCDGVGPSRDECPARLTAPVHLSIGVTSIKLKNEEDDRALSPIGNNATLIRSVGGSMGSRFKMVPVESRYKRGRWEAYDYYEGDESVLRSKFLRVQQGLPRVVSHPPTPPAVVAAIHPSASEANLASPSPASGENEEMPQSLTNSLIRCTSHTSGTSGGEGKENLLSSVAIDQKSISQPSPQTHLLLLRPRTQSNSTPATLSSKIGADTQLSGRITPSEMLHHYGLETSLSVASAHNMAFLNHPLSGDNTRKVPISIPLLPGDIEVQKSESETQFEMAATAAPRMECPLPLNNLPSARPPLYANNGHSFDHESLYGLLYNAFHAPKPLQKESPKRVRRCESESEMAGGEESSIEQQQPYSFAKLAPSQPTGSSHPSNTLGAVGAGTSFPAASSYLFSIDSKIEQAMDLVKTHLMFAVREEVETLRAKIVELESTVIHLEAENSILREHVPTEVLQSLDIPQQSQLQDAGSPNDGTSP